MQRFLILDESSSEAVEYFVDGGKERHLIWVGTQKARVLCARNYAGLVDEEEVQVLEARALVAFDLPVEEYPYRRHRRRPYCLAH